MAPRHSRESYAVGIICALDVERAAVEANLDEEHDTLDAAFGDDNVYTFGTIGRHNVVVASLRAGVMGKASAATVAKDMQRSFHIKLGLMVGIGGGVWSEEHDIRLGDVIVSQPNGMHSGVVQWDFGKMEQEGVFQRTGTLDKPPQRLLHAIQALSSGHFRKASEVPQFLQEMLSRYPNMAKEFVFQGREHDMLSKIRNVPERGDDHPRIHYGNIASGDKVMKDGPTRDRIAREEGILCFEMEAAGLMDSFPCAVIRGICDYADSHKDKRWQPYAAATAACYAKELLLEINPYVVPRDPEVERQKRQTLQEWLSPPSRQARFGTVRSIDRVGNWLCETQVYMAWRATPGEKMYCFGAPGTGKSMTGVMVVEDLESFRSSQSAMIGIAHCFCEFSDRLTGAGQLLADLVAQLLGEFSVPSLLLERFQQRGGSSTADLRPSELRTIYQEVCNNFSRIFIILDGLDEIRLGTVKDITAWVTHAESKGSCPVNLIATSRPVPEIDCVFEGCPRLEVQAREADMRRWMDLNAKHLPHAITMKPGGREKVEAKILEVSGSSFLLMALNHKSVSELRGRAYNEIFQNLDQLATTWEVAYDQIMARTAHDELARHTMLLVLRAKRRLTVQELRYAIACRIPKASIEDDDLPDEAGILTQCAGLLQLAGDRKTIQLAHFTAKEYLEKYFDKQDRSKKGETLWTGACVTYLSMHDFSDDSRGDWYFEFTENHSHKYPLLRYAMTFWPKHASALEEDDLGNVQTLMRMKPKICRQSLLTASANGDADCVSWLLKHNVPVDGSDDMWKTPLHHAASRKHPECVRVLLRQGAQSSLLDVDNMTPFHYAAQHLSFETVKVFLDHDPALVNLAIRRKNLQCRVNKRGERIYSEIPETTPREQSANPCQGLTALHLAALTGNLETARFLLDHDANVNALSKYKETPLQLALRKDLCGGPRPDSGRRDHWVADEVRIEVVLDLCDDDEYAQEFADICRTRLKLLRLLLRQPEICVISKDMDGKTALHYLHYWQRNRHQAPFLRLLLSACPDVSVPDRKGQTAMHLACRAGNVYAAKKLIKRNSSLTIPDNSGKTGLHYLGACQDLTARGLRAILQAASLPDMKDRLNARDSLDNTPLSYLLSWTWDLLQNQCAVLTVMINHGARAAHVTSSNTLGHLYANNTRQMDPEVLRVLANHECDLHAKDAKGQTILHRAVATGSLSRSSLEYLSSLGLSLDDEDAQNHTVWDVAKQPSSRYRRSPLWSGNDMLDLLEQHHRSTNLGSEVCP